MGATTLDPALLMLMRTHKGDTEKVTSNEGKDGIDIPIILTMADYKEAGEIKNALSMHADQIFNGLEDEGKK